MTQTGAHRRRHMRQIPNRDDTRARTVELPPEEVPLVLVPVLHHQQAPPVGPPLAPLALRTSTRIRTQPTCMSLAHTLMMRLEALHLQPINTHPATHDVLVPVTADNDAVPLHLAPVNVNALHHMCVRDWYVCFMCVCVIHGPAPPPAPPPPT
jgi:hypothetical protein